ncbi:MAG TPA: VOC family protein [Bryobacteraceae bacterium]|nr:VOC family protein [Bryobacteraceae bacterium]
MPTYDLVVETYMPNLENLQKQAKLIMRCHRERHYPVAAQIREYLPRFLNVSDSEILAASFKLSDAQEVVARQQGFDSWQALKTGLSNTPLKVKPSPSKATIVGAEPQLFVTDIKRSCEFYCEQLHFRLVFSYGRPPYYAQVGRDAARLNLRFVEQTVIASTVLNGDELLSVSMTVATADEIKLLFLEFQSAGVAFHQRLKKQPWGAKNFVVKDPDGNLLLFAGPAN